MCLYRLNTLNKYIGAMIFSILVSGCFPVYKEILPEIIIDVIDEKGLPLKNVEIVLYTEVSPAKKRL